MECGKLMTLGQFFVDDCSGNTGGFVEGCNCVIIIRHFSKLLFFQISTKSLFFS
jgi:hypothetical protein